MKLYHTSTAEKAASIVAEGFKDGEGTYLTTHTHRGVWLANSPLDINEGAEGDDVFLLEIPEDIVAPYEWIEEGKPYREFLVPAAIVNQYSVVGPRNMYELNEETWEEEALQALLTNELTLTDEQTLKVDSLLKTLADEQLKKFAPLVTNELNRVNLVVEVGERTGLKTVEDVMAWLGVSGVYVLRA